MWVEIKVLDLKCLKRSYKSIFISCEIKRTKNNNIKLILNDDDDDEKLKVNF